MANANITLSTRAPVPPAADFAFYINFKKGEGPASRVFSATHKFIQACEKFDKELLHSIDNNIETILVLEDIQVGSLKTWFRNVLEVTDDQALRNLDWKPQVGKYLIKAKYATLKWCEESEKDHDLLKISHDLHQLATESDVRHIPDYSPIRLEGLIEAIKNFQGVKDELSQGDSAALIYPEKPDLDFNLSTRVDINTLESMAIKNTLKQSAQSMVLVVRKPDYLSESRWDFRYGKRSLSAKIEDKDWLSDFHNRKIDIRPGDALECKVRIELNYGYDNELISEHYYIEEIIKVLKSQFQQLNLIKTSK